MSYSTVMIHLGAEPAGIHLHNADTGDSYVWLDLNAHTSVCIETIAQADALIRDITEARQMLQAAGGAS